MNSAPATGAAMLPTLVEASAGTGKTYAITTDFVRAILNRALTPEQIVVVTYTKAATAELRQRTRRRLNEAIAIAEGRNDTEDELRNDVDRTATRLGRDEVIERLRRARHDLDRAPIFTIHGFCQRLLQDYPLAFGVEFDFEVVEDSVSVLHDLAVDFWTAELHESPAWFVDALAAKRVTPEFLGRLAEKTANPDLPVLGPPPAEVDPDAIAEARRQLVETGRVWQQTRTEVESILDGDEGLHRGRYNRRTIQTKWVPGLDEMFARGSLTLPDWFEKLAQDRIAVKKGHDVPQHAFFESCARTLALCEAVQSGIDYRVFRFLERFIERARRESASRARERGILTYDELLVSVYRSLDDDTAAKIRQTYPLALVDEFQDTDSVQYGIFKRIYGEHAAVYVGDPKQAIYSFRGADVFSYLTAARDMGERQRELTVNRRSDPSMVAAVQALFSNQPAPFAHPDIRLPETTAHHEPRTTLSPAMEVLLLTRDQLADGPVENAVPAIVANEVALLLESDATIEGRAVAPQDVAVLCRSNRQALLVTEALRELAIPASLDGDSSVLGTEIASDFEAILQATLTPGDPSAVRRALLTELVGVTPSALHAMDDDTWSTWITRFRDWHDTWQRDGAIRFLEDLLRLCQSEARLGRTTTAKRRLTDLLHIEELLLRGERERHRDPVALMLWFRRLREGSPEDTSVAYEDLQQRPDADADTIRVTTVHKSKGLEYGIVYLPFLWRDAALFDFDRRVVKFHDPNDDDIAKLDLGSPRHADHLDLSKAEAMSEALRLLYVGVTRAKHRCTLLWGLAREWRRSALRYLIHGDSPPKKMEDERVRTDLDRLSTSSGGVIGWRAPSPETAARREASGQLNPLSVRRMTRSFDHANRIASFTSLTGRHEKTTPRGIDTTRDDAPDALFGELPGGARTGLLLHSLLERAPFDAIDSAEALESIERELRSYGYDPALAEAVRRDLSVVVDTPLLGDGSTLRLSEVAATAQLRELEFMLNAGGPDFRGLVPLLREHGAPGALADYADRLAAEPPRSLHGFLRGFIDLVFEWEGRWFVADYKSNSLARYGQRELVGASAESHYLLQVLLYSVATHRHLSTRVPRYDPHTQFGGAMLLFLRGMKGPAEPASGVYFDPMEKDLLEAVDRWLGGTR